MSLDSFELRSALGRLLPGPLRRGEYARPPLVGYLDRPLLRGKTLSVSGWLLARGTPIEEIQLAVGGEKFSLRMHLARPDVARELDAPWAALSGFAGAVFAPGAERLAIFARLCSGARPCAFVARIKRVSVPAWMDWTAHERPARRAAHP